MQRLGGTPQMWTLLSFTGRFDVAFLENAIARGAKGPPTMPGERTAQQKQQVRDAQMARARLRRGAMLERLQQRLEREAKAEKAKGAEKAKHLAEGLSLVSNELALNTYSDEVAEIIKLDADNKAGLKAKFEGLKNSVEFKSELEAAMRSGGADPKGVLAAIDKLIDEKKPTGEALQEALFYKGSIYFRDDKAKAKAALLEAQKLAPNSDTGQRINGILDRFFKEE